MIKNYFLYIFFLLCFSFAFILSLSGCNSSSEARIKRLEDIVEIQNVMSKHAWYYSAGMHQEELDDIWAMDEPDVTWGSPEGYWIGKDSIVNYYVTYHDTFRERDLIAVNALNPQVEVTEENYGAGTNMFHTNTTPIIEIAGDGKTAKGIWYSPGQVTQTPGGQKNSVWMWERYGVDFIKVNRKWKIWHLHLYTDFNANVYQDSGGGGFGGMGGPGGGIGGPAGMGGQGGPPQGMGAGQGMMAQGGPQGMRGPGGMGAPGGGQAGESQGAPPPDIQGEGMRAGGAWAVPKQEPRIPEPYYTFSETFSYGAPKQ